MKHRYIVTIAIATATLFPAFATLGNTVSRTLQDLNVKDPAGSAIGKFKFEQEYVFERETALTKDELAKFRAAIEAQYSNVGAIVEHIDHFCPPAPAPAPEVSAPPIEVKDAEPVAAEPEPAAEPEGNLPEASPATDPNTDEPSN